MAAATDSPARVQRNGRLKVIGRACGRQVHRITRGHTTDQRNALSCRSPPWQPCALRRRELFMASARPSIADKRKTFRELHRSGCFVIPNPWNVGTARYLQGLGFKALATTSSGHAHSQGFADGDQPIEDVLAHYREIAQAADIPLNADFENGYAHDPDGVARNVARCIETGVSGLSIEDFTGDDDNPLYDFDLALARVKAARKAIDQAGGDVVFTARTEGFIKNRPDLNETIKRLKAFSDAGADCLYSPGIKTREQIEATVKAVAPKAINFLNSGAFGFTVSDLAAMGVRRISVGGSLARVAMHAFIKTATEIAKDGKFDGFANLIGNPELNKFFREDPKKRS
jgi:2-methylisocitrate lyase-like PEP mutase family enzyme